ncbi:MAG: NAD(P)/FAD-dependent oxidoreductase [Planctomycetota bacterium]|nr:NAD(P)/FAD-dependent oxidoreductase [Planctomycetota bacterium]
MTKTLPKILIVGGGFAGLQVAKALRHAEIDLTLVDRRNHHLFQPLLYQVATASLTPAEISAPIRSILRKQKNCQVLLAQVHSVDVEKRRLMFHDGYVQYDYLVLAAGARHAYFGHDEWEKYAPGLKSLEDATELRRRILLAFETAEFEGSEKARIAALTFGIVGAGATGVELAGAIMEIAGKTLPHDYKHIDTRNTRVVIFEGTDRVLPPFPPELSKRAQRDLERMGVEIHLNSIVTNIQPHGVSVGNRFFPMQNVFWAAGVQASPLAKGLGVPLDRAGRVIVGPDLSIPGHREVFVLGDMAAAKWGDAGKSGGTARMIPGVAPAAIQMGQYAGYIILKELADKTVADHRPPFKYRDKGSLAVIGRTQAVAHVGKLKIGGFGAWLLWAVVHISFLIGFRNRVSVMFRWFWNWLLNAHDSRLIIGPVRLDIDTPRSADFVPLETQPERGESI